MKESNVDNAENRNSQPEIQNQKLGTLYIVSTPIGNMEDITLRALKVLKGVDIIAAESVAHTKKLCERHSIATKVTAYNQHNRKANAPRLVSRLKAGYDVAVVTDAGTPGISDPGVYLVNQAVKEDIKVSPIPGPSAVSAALSVSGMPSEQFLFLGFLPNKIGKRKNVLSGLTAEPRTMVFFEAPHRILAMLADVKEVLGDRQMVMLREITKIFEDVKRGSVSTVLQHLVPDRIRGEFTLVVAGKEKEKNKALGEEVLNRIDDLLVEGILSVRDIAELVSSEEGIAYRQVYKECLAGKRVIEKVEINGS